MGQEASLDHSMGERINLYHQFSGHVCGILPGAKWRCTIMMKDVPCDWPASRRFGQAQVFVPIYQDHR
jgi:hypothetical protein